MFYTVTALSAFTEILLGTFPLQCEAFINQFTYNLEGKRQYNHQSVQQILRGNLTGGKVRRSHLKLTKKLVVVDVAQNQPSLYNI